MNQEKMEESITERERQRVQYKKKVALRNTPYDQGYPSIHTKNKKLKLVARRYG